MVRCSRSVSSTSDPPQANAGVVQNEAVSGRLTGPCAPRMVNPLPDTVFASTSKALVPPPSLTLLPVRVVPSGMMPFLPMVAMPSVAHAARSALIVATLFSLALCWATNVGPPLHACPVQVSSSVQGLPSSQLAPSGSGGALGAHVPAPLQVEVPLQASPSSQTAPAGARQACAASLQTFWHGGFPAHGLPEPTQTPLPQVSVVVQNSPSVHEVPSGL